MDFNCSFTRKCLHQLLNCVHSKREKRRDANLSKMEKAIIKAEKFLETAE